MRADLPSIAGVSLFAIAAVIILVFGVMMARLAARLAEPEAQGEAIRGALFPSACTSLPEFVTLTWPYAMPSAASPARRPSSPWPAWPTGGPISRPPQPLWRI